jgi:hypothetical protein
LGALDVKVDIGAAGCRRDDTCVTQDAQMVRNRRLTEVERLLDIAGTQRLVGGMDEPYHRHAYRAC